MFPEIKSRALLCGWGVLRLRAKHNAAGREPQSGNRETGRGVFDSARGLMSASTVFYLSAPTRGTSSQGLPHITSRRFPEVSTIQWLWGRLFFGGIKQRVSKLNALGSPAVPW